MMEKKPRYPFYHSFAEVNRELLRVNAGYLQQNLDAGVRTAAVVKADAYGHGAVEVARVVSDLYDMFAVATVTEAVELRMAGIRNPILVFGVPLPQTAEAYTSYDLIAVVSSRDQFDILEPGTSYHVHFDTGMGRLGMSPDEISEIRDLINGRTRITCTGIMTHFATADTPESELLKHQKKLLRKICDVFRNDYPVHAANTAASLDHPDTHLDMVRHGIGLYGYDPTPEPSGTLQPVMKWKSWVAQCKPIRKGESLSYGATWLAPTDGHFAVVPTGYADGYRRGLSGEMPVLIEGTWYMQAGTVTMDYIMVWLGQHTYPAGTGVMVMGGECNHAGHWARMLNTIPYEVCSGINPKIPRIMV